jgi:hypothetical protein
MAASFTPLQPTLGIAHADLWLGLCGAAHGAPDEQSGTCVAEIAESTTFVYMVYHRGDKNVHLPLLSLPW